MAVINTLRNAGSDFQWLTKITGDLSGRTGDGAFWPETYPFLLKGGSIAANGVIVRFGDGTNLTSYTDATPNANSPSSSQMGYWFNDQDGCTKISDDMWAVDKGFKVGDLYIVSSTFEYDGSTQGEGTSRYVSQEDGYIRYFDRATKTLHKIQASGTTGRVMSVYVHGDECWVTITKTAFADDVEFGYIDLDDMTYHRAFEVSGERIKYISLVTDTTVFFITYTTVDSDTTNYYRENYIPRAGGTIAHLDIHDGHGYDEPEQEWINLYNNGRYYLFSTMDRLFCWDDTTQTAQDGGTGTNGSTTQLTKFMYADANCCIVRGGVASSYDVYAMSFTTGNMVRIIDTSYADPFDEDCVYVVDGRIFITSAMTCGNGVWFYKPSNDSVVAANDLVLNNSDLWDCMGGNYGEPIAYNTTLFFIPNERKTGKATTAVGGTLHSYLVTFDTTNETFDVPGFTDSAHQWECIHGFQYSSTLLYLLAKGKYNDGSSSYNDNNYVDVVSYNMNTRTFNYIKGDIFKSANAYSYNTVMIMEPDRQHIFFDTGMEFTELDLISTGKPYYLLQDHENAGDTYVYSDIVIHVPLTNRNNEVYTGYAYAFDVSSRRVVKLSPYEAMHYFENNYGWRANLGAGS